MDKISRWNVPMIINSSRRSWFFKADQFMETLANERRDGRSLSDSCYEPIDQLRDRAGISDVCTDAPLKRMRKRKY